ncbi:unnamed protein product [Urochloa decumbens]|uniref:Ubiquitin-like domain-containing protein n=1 Tax=Urochloa decumbens TaxID=240449 RepID=A0ABC9GFV2_9POAL
MDVTFETTQGHRFNIQIWYFSTVRRIKESILKYQGIPMEAQQLFFMGRELQDDYDTEYYSIVHGSHILVVIRNGSSTIAESHTSDVHVVFSVPSLGRSISLNLKTTDHVAQLKKLLQEHTDGAVLADQVTLFFDKVEMEEGKLLSMYNPPIDRMEVKVVVTQSPQEEK